MRHTMFLPVLALCAGVTSAQEMAQHDEATLRHPVQRLATLEVSSIPKTRGHRASYSAVLIQDLHFTATLSPTLQGEHQLKLRLYTPRGHLYQTLKVPVVAPPPPPPSRRKPAPRRPIVVTTRLPVAGTPIVASGLYGRWRVVPHLDNADEPCGHALGFQLTP